MWKEAIFGSEWCDNDDRWEVVGSVDGIQYGPFPVPQQGLPARFWPEATSL